MNNTDDERILNIKTEKKQKETKGTWATMKGVREEWATQTVYTNENEKRKIG